MIIVDLTDRFMVGLGWEQGKIKLIAKIAVKHF